MLDRKLHSDLSIDKYIGDWIKHSEPKSNMLSIRCKKISSVNLECSYRKNGKPFGKERYTLQGDSIHRDSDMKFKGRYNDNGAIKWNNNEIPSITWKRSGMLLFIYINLFFY